MIQTPETIVGLLTTRFSDRLSYGFLYVLISAIILFFGFRMINHAWEVRFFKDYLMSWEVSINEFEAHHGIWPVFTGSNHAQYMSSLMTRFQNNEILLPRSNTGKGYRYLIKRFGQENENIFILAFRNRLVIYGISEKTLSYLERAIDREVDFGRGRISGRIGKNNNIYVGQWRL